MNSNPNPQPPTWLHSMIPLLNRACKITVSMCAAAVLGLASSGYAAGISDATATAPTPGANDQSSLTGDNDSGNYVDNQRPGQSFTVGANSLGYVFTGLLVREKTGTAGGGQPTATTYNIRVYSMTNATAGNATLLTTYIMTNQLTITQGNWIRVSGMTNVLAANGIYAFSINRTGSGWWTPAADSTQPYANGRSGNYPTAAFATPSFNNYDLAFDVNLTAITDPFVGATIVSPATVFAGPTVTLSATFSGTAPFTSFVWQSDGGSNGVTWTALSPASTTNTYSFSTTGMAVGTNQYRLIVTGGAGTITNTPGSLILKAPSAPFIVVNTAIAPATTFAGNVVTMSATFDGSSPLAYQWQKSDGATFTNNISGATSSTYTISDALVAHTGQYRLVCTNSIGLSNSAFASLTVTNVDSSIPVQILNLGATTPVASGSDIAQLSSVGNQKFPSGGLNYYSDNAATVACGQTFTTGSNPDGYLLSSLYLQWGSIEGAHVAANPYTLTIYSMSGTTATLLQTYTNQNSAAAMAVGNWTKWIGLSNILAPNAVYAYSIRARSVANVGTGFMQVGNASGNPYAGGVVGLFPSVAGGTANLGNSADDATFLIHLAAAPASAPVIQAVNIAPANSVANPVFVGSPVTLSVVSIGSSPAYQWLSDNGTAGVTFTPISGATSNPYVLDTSSLSPSTQYQYQVTVTNIAGSATSSSVLLNLTNASGPVVVSATTITPSVVIVGNNSVMTASFKGSLPISYQWQHAGTNLPGATTTTLAITGAQFTDAGTYSLVASNNPPGIGPTTASSLATLYVVNPPQTNNADAKIADGGTSPFVGSYDVYQLTDASVTPPGLNYYVDNARPPGQTFTTSNAPPTAAGYPLNYVYVKHDPTGANNNLGTAQTFTLRIYEMLDGTNAQLLTSYVTTNSFSHISGDWVRIGGLTNVLKTNTTYAYAFSRNTLGYWRLACNVGVSSSGNG